MTTITRIEDLEALYGAPGAASLVKEARRLTPHYRALLEASPFYALATGGPEGLDCSPRGDLKDGIVIADDATLHLPDRRGNNRVDSLRNIVRDPRVALLFLIPGCDTTLRINGRAVVSVDPGLLSAYAVEGKPPRSVIVVTIETVYFQCARAILRADLWNPARHADAASVSAARLTTANGRSGRKPRCGERRGKPLTGRGKLRPFIDLTGANPYLGLTRGKPCLVARLSLPAMNRPAGSRSFRRRALRPNRSPLRLEAAFRGPA